MSLPAKMKRLLKIALGQLTWLYSGLTISITPIKRKLSATRLSIEQKKSAATSSRGTLFDWWEYYRIVVPKGDQSGHHVDDGGDDKVCKIVIGPGILALNEIIERLKDNIISQKHSNEHYIAGYRPA